jgi:hypothetical protein
MKGLRIAVILALAMGLTSVGSPAAVAQTIKDFEGRFVGRGITRADQHISYNAINNRDLDVVIKATDGGGFSVTWSTVFRGRWSDDRSKWKTRTTTVEFVPADKAGMWRGKASGDLVAGAPAIWAFLKDKALYVHIVEISDKGDLLTSSYRRGLVKDGMRLDFRGTQNGNRVRQVVGWLKREK